MKYLCLTDSDEIGASCHAVVCGGESLVVDSGLHPKKLGYEAMPPHDLLDGIDVKSIVITHSHLDHVGTLPVLQERFPEASVFLTAGAYDLSDAMLHNSVNVMTSQQKELSVPEYPLFTHTQVDEQQKRWQIRKYNKIFDATDELRLKFQDAGHVMGSSAVSVYNEDKKILFTGDVQSEDQTLIKGADIRDEGDYDALVMETTRGAVTRPEGFTRKKEEERLAQYIAKGLEAGGAVLIPVFAMGKTQEILTMIHQFKEEGIIPDVPVHVGGLSTKMTTIYDRYASRTRRRLPKFKILRDMDVKVARKGKRGVLECKAGEIYCLSSGMMTENTVSSIFARHFIENPLNMLLFVGYSDPDSPAGKIKAAKRGEEIVLDAQHTRTLECQVECFDFSGHAPREDLLKIAIGSGAKKIFLTHGDKEARTWFRKELEKLMPDSELVIPKAGEEYEV